MIHESLGNKIRELRESRNLTQYELADLSKLSQNTINRLENYKVRNPLDLVKKIAKGLDIQEDELVSEIKDIVSVEEFNMMYLGLGIAKHRQLKNLNQTQLADLAGSTRGTISRIELGETLEPKKQTIQKIAELIDLPFYYTDKYFNNFTGLKENSNLGAKIRYARIKKSYTVKNLAKDTGISKEAISEIERGFITKHKQDVQFIIDFLEMKDDGTTKEKPKSMKKSSVKLVNVDCKDVTSSIESGNTTVFDKENEEEALQYAKDKKRYCYELYKVVKETKKEVEKELVGYAVPR